MSWRGCCLIVRRSWSVVLRRRRKVGAAAVQDRKLHGRMVLLLYGRRSGNVTPLGSYRTNWGRRRG